MRGLTHGRPFNADNTASDNKRMWCGIYHSFVEGHDCRVQHSAGVHKQQAATKYEIFGGAAAAAAQMDNNA